MVLNHNDPSCVFDQVNLLTLVGLAVIVVAVWPLR